MVKLNETEYTLLGLLSKTSTNVTYSYTDEYFVDDDGVRNVTVVSVCSTIIFG